MSERDKFLNEAMGECWHVAGHPLYVCKCMKGCGTILNSPASKPVNLELSTWQGFGKLWEWAIDQEWWCEFEFSRPVNPDQSDIFGGTLQEILQSLINPDRFATAVYEYLKEK
jgi:hypothetical protein